MKKLLFILACVFFAVAANARSKVYVNPMQNNSNAGNVIAQRLYKKGLLGLTKAKTISVASGTSKINPGSNEAQDYDYIMDVTLTKSEVSEAPTVSNLLSLGSSNKNPDWLAELITDIVIYEASTGKQVFNVTLKPNATNKDKNLAVFNATNNFDYDMTDMTDDAFRIGGEVLEATESDKKNNVKKIRAQIGSNAGARKDQAFEIYKVVDGNRELIGAAKCEQVLNGDESILSVNTKKGADKVVSDLIQNLDGTYQIEVWSRSKSGFIHNNFPGLDKLFAKEGRPDYMDPFNREVKPKVAFLALEINDNNFASQKDNFLSKVVQGMSEVPTIELVPTIYPNVEEARKAGIDGLIEITIDKVFNTTEQTKEGKINYKTEILYTVSGMDVANNQWIDMKSFSGLGTSQEGYAKANADALTLMDDRIKKYSEDLFPVAASIIMATEEKNGSVKKASIDVGTNMGVKKGMKFDIYEQRAEGGSDSRFLLGEGSVEKDGLTANEAVIKVKGKNDGDKKLYNLLQNMDEDTKIILVSKASYDVFDKVSGFFNKL